MNSLGDPPPPHVTEQAWKQHMIQLHNKEAPKKRSRAPRGGALKRKRSSVQEHNHEEELVWSLERLLQNQREEGQQRRQRRRQQQQVGVALGGEEDACALDYLQLRYSGNVRAAEMNVLVDLSAGRGKYSSGCCLREDDDVQSTTNQH
jgi:hypothetical protein